MSGLDQIKEQNARIITLMEERSPNDVGEGDSDALPGETIDPTAVG